MKTKALVADIQQWVRRFAGTYGSALVAVGMGFASAILVPRAAIGVAGPEAWGATALLLSYGLAAAYGELGLTNGLTRQFGALSGAGQDAAANALLATVAARAKRLGILLALATAFLAVAVLDLPLSNTRLFLSVFAAGVANVVAYSTDILLIPARARGEFVTANLIRATYYATLVVGVGALAVSNVWQIDAVAYLQLLAASISMLMAKWTRPICDRKNPANSTVSQGMRQVFTFSLPDQIGKIQSSFWPSVERTLLAATGGLAVVGALDLAVRLSLIVSTLPMLIASPVLAILSVQYARHGGEPAEREALPAAILTGLLAVSLGGAVLLAVPWLGSVAFGAGAMGSREISSWVIAGTTCNVLSAVPMASSIAAGRARLPVGKAIADVVTLAAAVAAAAASGSPAWYLRVRFGGLAVVGVGVTAIWMSRAGKSR